MLQETNIEIIKQLSDLLKVTDKDIYKNPLKTLHFSTVGQHVRHIAEFYLCLLKGYQTEIVNYDARQRDLRIESDRDFALENLAEIINKLNFVKTDKNLSLQTSFGSDETLDIPSSFFRELTYLIEHTIHHLAIIKIGLNESYPAIKFPENFGVAHSTIRFRQKSASA
jgi:uncharacterized damage-inducible protein DinB